MSIESLMLSNHLVLCHPFLLLPSVFPSVRIFSNELAVCIRLDFQLQHSPFNEYSELISFRIDWFDLLQNGLVGSPCSPRDSQSITLLACEMSAIELFSHV